MMVQKPNAHRHNPYYIDKTNPRSAGVSYCGSIPVHMPPSNTHLDDKFICQMIEEGLFTISYQEALRRMGHDNICEVHRDPPGSSASYYRVKLMEKLGRKDDGFLSAQMQFWVPLPDRVETVRLKWKETAE